MEPDYPRLGEPDASELGQPHYSPAGQPDYHTEAGAVQGRCGSHRGLDVE
jgi:hypothetical protein